MSNNANNLSQMGTLQLVSCENSLFLLPPSIFYFFLPSFRLICDLNSANKKRIKQEPDAKPDLPKVSACACVCIEVCVCLCARFTFNGFC